MIAGKQVVWKRGRGPLGVGRKSKLGMRGILQRICHERGDGVQGDVSSCLRRYRGRLDASGGDNHKRNESFRLRGCYACPGNGGSWLAWLWEGGL